MAAILGISAYYHDSAACLVRDGEIAEAQLVPVDVAIGSPFALALKNDAHSDVHLAPLRGGRGARFRPRARPATP